MIVRHISFPKRSNLIPLIQPKEVEQQEQMPDNSAYLTRTLNPQVPIRDVLVAQQDPNSKPLAKIEKQSSEYSFKMNSCLTNEVPQELDLPIQNIDTENTQQISKQSRTEESSYRLPSFGSKNNETNSRFIINKQSNVKKIVSQSQYKMVSPIQPSNFTEDDSDSIIKKPHSFRTSAKNRLSETLQKFKSLKIQKMETRISSSNRYTFSEDKPTPPRHSKAKCDFSQNSQNQEESSHSIQRVLFTQIQKQKQSIFKSTFRQKLKKNIPNEEEFSESPSMIFNNQKQMLDRKFEEDQNTLFAKPESKILQLTNKFEKRSRRDSGSTKLQRIEISIKTSLLRLKEICCMHDLQTYDVVMKIPELFAYPLFSGQEDQYELKSKTNEVLRALQMNNEGDIYLKKYSNCVIITNKQIGIVSHFSGKIYIGGWKNEFSQQGCKSGLGLEWYPRKYVYYGQFSNNKKEGVGLMKNNTNEMVAGVWHENRFIGTLHEASPSEHRSTSRGYSSIYEGS